MTMVDETTSKNEVWMNPTAGTVFVLKMDHRGDLSRHEQVDSGRRFNITTEERQLNMERAANERQCPFRNGILQPVRLLGTDDESRELAENPNAMAESDMRSLVTGHHKTFEAKLARIHNLATIERLLAIAYQEDAPIKRVERIRQRQVELHEGVLGATRARMSPDPSQGNREGQPTFGKPVSLR